MIKRYIDMKRINSDSNCKFNFFLGYTFFAYMILDQKIFTLILNNNKSVGVAVISVFEIILQVTTIVLEIPTGMMGDNYSKKTLLIIAKVSNILYCVIMLLTNNAYILGVAFLSLGIGEALVSGTEESFISEIADSENELLKKYMFCSTVNQFSTVLAVLLGGILINYSWKVLYVIMIIGQIMSILFLCRIDYIHKDTFSTDAAEYIKILAKIKNENSAWLKIGLIGAFFASIYSVYTIYLPLYLKYKGIDFLGISIISCIEIILGFIIMALLGKYAEQKSSKRICIIAVIMFVAGLPFMASNNTILLSLGAIVSSAVGVTFFPAITTLINEALNDAIRATGNSIVNLFQTIFMCIAFALIGIYI